ncbi:MAG TPA: hypothetical protein VHW64_03715 [Nocardioides sp.]|jgi:hypothetical protein|uniref:trypsin-like serine peptidase n=1 Tax=Nocardioides sp. TaxID=35761 RepID=UPI002E307802|nr:hypothetical protein [Nocardioides sp.]HEX3929783.1 hypothetical protein [Nocardioides sp.]
MAKPPDVRRAVRIAATAVAGLAVLGGLAAVGGVPDSGRVPAAGLLHSTAKGPGASSLVSSHAAAVTTPQQEKVEAYWTPHRMSTAIPTDAAVGNNVLSREETSPPVEGKAVKAMPNLKMGRVFFKIGAVDYSCSGTLVSSASGDVVATAGHCVFADGAYVSSFSFVPEYHDGQAPGGVYAATKLVTTAEYAGSEDLEYDVGFASMDDVLGIPLETQFGAYPISFAGSPPSDVQIYGYPAQAPFDGSSMWTCSSDSVRTVEGSHDLGLPCDMTGGASGGAWLSHGTLVSVSSFHYVDLPGVLWGPTLGADAEAAYHAAASA